MRIAWITTGFSKDENDYSGAAAIHNLARELSLDPEIELSIFTLYYPLNQPEYNFYNAKVYSFALPGFESKLVKRKIWKNCEKKFQQMHNEKKFDIVHSVWAGESGYVASKLSKKFALPLIVNICGGELAGIKEIQYGSRLRYWQKRFVDRSLNTANKIVSGSEYITHKINKYYGENIPYKVVNIPFGIDEKVFFPLKKHEASDHPVLLNIGSAVPVKAHNILFESLKIVRKNISGVNLIHCGRDDEGILAKMVSDMDLKSYVKLMKFMPYEKMPEIINDTDIYVSSSLYESQNMSLIEASFCGLPVVSTDVGAAREVTENIVKPGDPVSLANKIIQVISELESEREKVKMNMDKIKGKFSLKNSVKRFTELYNSLSKLA